MFPFFQFDFGTSFTLLFQLILNGDGYQSLLILYFWIIFSFIVIYQPRSLEHFSNMISR